MEKNKKKGFILWIVLVILIFMTLGLTYVKFFGSNDVQVNNSDKTEENSNDEAINLALSQIVENFNNNKKIEEYKQQNINIKATLNNYSLFISYTTDKTTTYEFHYSDLKLEIAVKNDEENLKKFKIIYAILIEAIQERLGNQEEITEIITSFLNDSSGYEGLEKSTSEDKQNFIYTMDITRKLVDENEALGNDTNNIDNQNTNE